MRKLYLFIRLTPEVVTIPLGVIIYIASIFALRHVDDTTPAIDLKHWLAFPFTILVAFFANQFSYLAIKFNRPDLWKQYRFIMIREKGYLPKEFGSLWWRYYVSLFIGVFLSLYLVA
jgi:hypothetical protein